MKKKLDYNRVQIAKLVAEKRKEVGYDHFANRRTDQCLVKKVTRSENVEGIEPFRVTPLNKDLSVETQIIRKIDTI